MAATKTSRNDTPNTPDVDESKIARMKVDDLRRELKARGVKGTADLKKPELVKKMIKVATGSGKKNPTSRNDTPNTPDVDESKIARMKVDDLRRELKARGVKGTADLKKPELVKKMIKVATGSGKKNPTSRNDTPNTPDVDESKIARMKADDLRRKLKARGVKGTADLKKPELVKKYIKAVS